MAEKKEKKDATTDPRVPASELQTSDSDLDSYHTADGSIQSLKPSTSPAARTTPPAARPSPPTARPPSPATGSSAKSEPQELAPLPWRASTATSRSNARPTNERRNQSVFSNRSIDGSIFGEDLRPRYDSEVRRPTVIWPASGCIHIPLRPPDSSAYDEAALNDENLAPRGNVDENTAER